MKEPFREAFKPSCNFLNNCASALADTGTLIHVKPEHLLRHDDAELRTPFESFRAAKAAGFTQVVTTVRENFLDRDLSSYDQAIYSGSTDKFRSKHYIRRMHCEMASYNLAYGAAIANGFIPVVYKYADLVHDTCETVENVAMGSLNCRGKLPCIENDRQQGISRHVDLESRIGHEAAQDLMDQLTGRTLFPSLSCALVSVCFSLPNLSNLPNRQPRFVIQYIYLQWRRYSLRMDVD